MSNYKHIIVSHYANLILYLGKINIVLENQRFLNEHMGWNIHKEFRLHPYEMKMLLNRVIKNEAI